MLKVIVIRKPGDQYAHGHIGAEGCDRVFCGMPIPSAILEMWDDPRNPYVGKGKVSCVSCLTEWNDGRTSGFRAVVGDSTSEVSGVEDGSKEPQIG